MINRKPGRPRLTWNTVVLKAVVTATVPVTLDYLYAYVEVRAPKLVATNRNWRANIRQAVQWLRNTGLAQDVSDGVWKATWSESRDASDQSA